LSHPCYVIRMTIPYPMNEQARKLVHLVFGVAIAAVILILPREEAIVLFRDRSWSGSSSPIS